MLLDTDLPRSLKAARSAGLGGTGDFLVDAMGSVVAIPGRVGSRPERKHTDVKKKHNDVKKIPIRAPIEKAEDMYTRNYLQVCLWWSPFQQPSSFSPQA